VTVPFLDLRAQEPEVGSAGYEGYAVFDPECAATPRPAFCQGPGLRWLKQTRDHSSGSTGSSVFDFNGDGQAEVVYRDECWLRVYDGKTGLVRFASSITSGTIIELPVHLRVARTPELLQTVENLFGSRIAPLRTP